MSIVADDISHQSGRRRAARPYARSRTKGYTSSGDENLLDKEEAVRIDMREDDNWGENTTCVTGNTSEHSYTPDDYRPTTLLSPPAMVAMPKTLGPLVLSGGGRLGLYAWNTTECTPQCEGLLIAFSFKLFLLLIAIWALYMRRSVADMPRLFLPRAFMLFCVLFSCVAFWLFYAVRIIRRYESNYLEIVHFADYLLTLQIFIHYTATVLLWLRPARPEYKIRVVRSPDGESRSYNVGQLSIQQAAVEILKTYYCDFSFYNQYLLKLPGSSRLRMKGGGGGGGGGGGSTVGSAVGGLKYYSLEGGDAEDAAIPQNNAQAIIIAAARKRDSGHNERFYEELDWERRVKKRKARLITAAEEAFLHIKRLNMEKNPSVPMDAEEAAKAIFPTLGRPLQKYLRVTRQQPRHNAEQVIRHLSECLSFDLGPRAFLERFFSAQETFEASEPETKWSILTEDLASREIDHATTFVLSCHAPGPNAGVQLHCTVSRLPFVNLTEEPFDHNANKFVLRLNSETSV